MREIKFRAWIVPIAKMVGWEVIRKECDRFSLLQDTKFVFMQFTGLLDKSGKEIYENDIIVKKGHIWFDEGKPNYRGTVEWIYSQWQVVAHCVNSDKRGISDGINEGINNEGIEEGQWSDWEIIGNVFENPELIREEKR